ncbi:MAG: ATP-binding protein [Eubacteriales bacterium]|nr:ATP-binding protein [Eubacteriales bacterium]
MNSSTVSVDLLNTPGIYYAAAYMLSSLIFLHVVPSKRSEIVKWAIYVPFSIVLCVFMAVTKGLPIALFVPLLLVDVAWIILMFWLITDLSFLGCVYYTARSFIYGEFVAALNWQLLYFVITALGKEYNLLTSLLVTVPVYLILIATATWIELKNRKHSMELEVNPLKTLGAVAIALMVYVFSNISFVARNTPFSAHYTSEILLLRMVVDTSGVIILFLYHIVLTQMQASMEAKTLQNMLDTQYANYRTSRDSVDLINQKYHDLKHQIEILRRESNSDEKLKYLDKMERDIRQYEAQNKTGNNILDIILTSKSLSCQRHHTELTVVADGSLIGFMDAMDISSLFGNALDNAIESVRRIENYSERLIHLTIVQQKSFVHITVENRYVGEIRFRNGLPVTTKSMEVGYHGFGVKSIKSTVEKYGGSLTVSADNGWFRLNILIARPQQ